MNKLPFIREECSAAGPAEARNRVQGGTWLTESQTQRPHPIVSVVVVVYRACAELGALIGNLSPFRSSDTELIIIDGGSDDGSVELLQQYSDQIDFWQSGPDGGIYDAMNKGVAASRGHYILHINAGDRLLQLPLAELALLAQREIDVVCCRVVEDDARLFTPRDGWLMRIDNPWHHQGTFYSRTAHLGYDPSYRVFGDFDHNQRLSMARKSVELIDVVIATHKTDGVSRNRKARQEIFRSIRANYGFIYLVPAFVRFQINRLRYAIRRG